MLFNSPEFLFLFLPTTLVVFYLLGNHGYLRAAILWLVLASLFFYGYWDATYLWLVIGSILANYSLGIWLSSYAGGDKRRNFVLAFGITLNLSLLAYFKYANFFLDSLSAAGGNRHPSRIHRLTARYILLYVQSNRVFSRRVEG